MTAESGPPTSEAAPLGERPADDDLALTVAQARIEAKLFGVETTVAVGRYRLLELVGRGGMGVVWGAWDPELERKVAIKLVDPLHTAARDRIVDEARALAKLSHPDVVPVYDVGVVDDRVYLVMEWVAGENLRAHCTAVTRFARSSTSTRKRRAGWPRSTPPTSSTATSSPRTRCSAATDGCACSTSASRAPTSTNP